MIAGRVDVASGARSVSAVLTDRHGGVSRGPWASLDLARHVGDDPLDVAENRVAVAARLGLDPDRVVWMDQVHGADVAVVDAPGDGPVAGVDALVTERPGLALAVLVADCVPVVVLAPGAGAVAVAHAGRRGLAAGVVGAAVDALLALPGVRRSGQTAGDLVGLVGPAACGRCYEVPAGMADAVEAVLPGTRGTTRAGTPSLDLPAGAASVLRARGLRRVDVDPRCTLESPDLFSHRRDGGRTGRQAAYAWAS